MQPCGLCGERYRQRLEVHGIGCDAVKRAMSPAPVVEIDISSKPRLGVRYTVVGVQIDLFVLDRLPESFHEHVVAPRALAVHANGNAVLGEQVGELRAGELATLGVEDLGYAVAGNQRVQATV
ncbi:MAG: hypothetical protein JWN13_3926 [Betaproteobacteria bacterium]|nr:hypothetical protein [Betaproteobacteria bacterium]